MAKKLSTFVLIVLFGTLVSGCSAINKFRRADELQREVADLKGQVRELEQEKNSALEKAKKDLEASLGQELKDYKAKLEMTERGLVITFVAEIFFDPGKDVLRSQGQVVLQKVAKVLNKDVPGSNIAVEGHTDTDPIMRSGWKSNWELSSARSLSVLHYFVDQGKVAPQRLSANAYGQFKSVAPNETSANKQKNRRVEIVILPELVKKASQ